MIEHTKRDPESLLMIEPGPTPYGFEFDSLTESLTWALERATERHLKDGERICSACGISAEADHYVIAVEGREFVTNALALHYLVSHRSQVPQRDLEIVREFLRARLAASLRVPPGSSHPPLESPDDGH